MAGNLMILSQVFAADYACGVDGEKLGIRVARWGVREVQGDARLGLRAVGLENRPTCAAHLDIGQRCKPLFWALLVERLSEPARLRGSASWLEAMPR